jgi:hypothetical protein
MHWRMTTLRAWAFAGIFDALQEITQKLGYEHIAWRAMNKLDKKH